MSRITLEPATKEVKNGQGERAFDQGVIRVKMYSDDGQCADGMSLEVFEDVIESEGNWVMVNSAFSVNGKGVPGREAKYSDGQIEVKMMGKGRVEELQSKSAATYYIKDDILKSFALVAKQTRINLREYNQRKQGLTAA